MDRSDAPPVDVGTRKQLFADDLIIGQQENVFRTLNQPTKNQDNPIIALEPPQTGRRRRACYCHGHGDVRR